MYTGKVHNGVGEFDVTLFSSGLLMIFCSAFLTTLSTRGFPSSVLYIENAEIQQLLSTQHVNDLKQTLYMCRKYP